ncbi:MAG: AEC family transporter [Anaerolineales bacterium]|nr:AEC family transporter [Anaerolineales bacterium]
MNTLFSIFANNLLPIFLAAAIGYLAGKFLKVDTKSISNLALYAFSPCLIFTVLTTNSLSNDDISRIVLFTLVSTLLLGLLTWVLGKLLNFKRDMLAAILIITMFSNAGNFGLSLNLFAFGEKVLAYASLYFVVNLIMIYSLGVFIASSGKNDLKTTVIGLIKLPAIYAVILAILINLSQWKVPVPIERTISTLAAAAVPSFILVLGLQLSKIKLKGHLFHLSVATILRLVVSPALAFAMSGCFGLTGAAYQAAITQSAMPTAVLNTVLATKYDLEPSFVTEAVLASTILCPLTLTPLLMLLGV